MTFGPGQMQTFIYWFTFLKNSTRDTKEYINQTIKNVLIKKHKIKKINCTSLIFFVGIVGFPYSTELHKYKKILILIVNEVALYNSNDKHPCAH